MSNQNPFGPSYWDSTAGTGCAYVLYKSEEEEDSWSWKLDNQLELLGGS